MQYTEKLKAIFDKENYSLQEFAELIAFLTQGETLQNARWVTHRNTLYPSYDAITTEQAFYSDYVIGLVIYVPL